MTIDDVKSAHTRFLESLQANGTRVLAATIMVEIQDAGRTNCVTGHVGVSDMRRELAMRTLADLDGFVLVPAP